MCQMYAIFEKVVGPQPSVTFTKDPQKPDGEDKETVVISLDPGQPVAGQDCHDTSAQYASSKSKPKKSPTKHSKVYGHRYSSTLPRSNRRRLPSTSDLDDMSTTSSSNPLLDTISVLTYDPPDDSDDYYDLTSSDYEQGESKDSTEKAVKISRIPGNRDSVGYAGSSSIDSGYKSFCPTPELPDSSFYGADRTHQLSGFYPDSTIPQVRSGKAHIMMGTKVISRQGQVPPTSLRDSPRLRRSDSSLYDVNLDHLMYLRQSLLSAIQKCEQSKASETDTNQRNDKTSVEDQRYSDYSPAKSPSYQKTVRFNTDVKVSTVNSSQPPSENSNVVNPCGRTADPASDATNKVQSKSILKDPLCANLRSQLEADTTDCTLEEEIDSLLYGRAEFYDLESVDEFPCSYVTMIEEKYRSGKPSLAKVRKLKGGKPLEQTAKSPPSSETDEVTQLSTPGSEDDGKQSQTPPKDASTSPTSTVSISKTAKCRFTEVARCMLEIIEDLQMKKMLPESASKDATTTNGTVEPSKPAEVPSESKAVEVVSSETTDSKSQTYTSAAEYHVYEEIDYDFVGEPSILKAPEVPPPLPARPITMFIKSDQHRPRVPSPPPRKSRCTQRRALNSGSDEQNNEVRNRPKQRGNLYCLFADRTERRKISKSLEREFKVSEAENDDDDYGFKKEFPSI